ncbi:hypothetical protein [Comamonas sp. C11]|uniref:hypothetical protein n=1 Tax=Comamonas sp. C11 TaxID=2966554 RepID=UPI0021116D4B|nr:hypothetical protein [Comamonas sp. C11]UUC94163.1 hypothetical protein NOX35_02055 [Comamonas sp. C11]
MLNPAEQVFKKLKILVSAVRFRPRPPDMKPQISNDLGLFSLPPRMSAMGMGTGQQKAERLALALA